ncbi:autotransporter outer membrane beta-barrel domain-containing protein [Pararobbsia silviterrae]|uniref:Autotransporter domain-containing protein n=1 Tax=Pararobbsia silviterrae TaxID=1792498 RepID=A0A494XUB6_9BURK|nr:autotransporter domain-containing protein [Pararobbsia silviterrae]RKP53432.1 autotransporter domain-containing protein [Pararobbsia silviterrae]
MKPTSRRHPRRTAISLALAAALAAPPVIVQAQVVSGASGPISATDGLDIDIGTNGAVSNTRTGVQIGSGVSIGTLSNSGSITVNGSFFDQNAINNAGSIGTLTNSGTISVTPYTSIGGYPSAGILNTGTITTLTNSSTGVINVVSGWNCGDCGGGYNAFGIYNGLGGLITSLINNGSISATAAENGTGVGIQNLGTIGTLTNTGTINGNDRGIYNDGTITTLINGTTGSPVSGSVISGGNTGIYNDAQGQIGTLTNNGTISGGSPGVYNLGTIGTLTNHGSISGGISGVFNNGTISTLTNTGTIHGGETGVLNEGSLGALSNSGTISGDGWAIFNSSSGTLGPITNSGLIEGTIENDSSNDLTIGGGTGATFGTLTGNNGAVGLIENTSSNVVFNTGNLVLNDTIDVGSNTVQNTGATLRVNTQIAITGNYTQSADATLLSGVTSSTNYGSLVVSGNATIDAGSSVGLKSQSYAFADGQRYIVVSASGTGTYNVGSLQYSATGYDGTIIGEALTVDGQSDLELCLGNCSGTTSPSSPSSGPATQPNSIASLTGIGHYTGYNADLMNLSNAVLGAQSSGSSAVANRVGAQLAPTHSSSGAGAAAAPTFDVLAVVAAHADSLRLAQDNGDGSGSASGIATGEASPQWAVWGQGFGGHASQGAVDAVDGYSANYGGVLLGADHAIDDHWRAGGVFSYSNSLIDQTGNSDGDSTRVNGYGLIGYASYTGQPWYVNLAAGAVQERFDTTRQIDFTGFSSVANGSFSGQLYVTSVEGGWPLAVGHDFTLTPLASLTYSYQHQNGYTESGGSGAGLTIDATHDISVRSALGAKLERGFDTSYGAIVPDLKLMWIHEYDHSKEATTANFTAAPAGETAFTTVGSTPVADLADVQLGVTLLKANNLTLTARYELQAGAHFTSQTGTLRLRQLF